MVSLLGRDDGLGHTLKCCLTKCYKKLRAKIYHHIFTETTQLYDIFHFVMLKCRISRLFILDTLGAPNELFYKNAVLQWVFCWEN